MPYRYPATARWFHWITVVLVIVLGGLGVWMTSFEPKDEAFKDLLYDIHESTGVALFVIVALRLLRRLANPPAPLPSRLPPTVRFTARTNHALMYAVLLVQPATGFLAANAWGYPLVWAGLVPIPSPIGHDETIAPLLSSAHLWGALLLLGLVALHLAGVAYHGVTRRDGVVQRMI
jgi:cytochrome b561